MATIKEMKKKFEDALKIDKVSVCKGEKNQIMFDLNGDGEPEAALIDTTDSGTPDVLAVDLTGDHKFNLYMDDTDDNDFPDVLYLDRKGDGNIQLLGLGEEMRGGIHDELVKIYAVLVDEESGEEELNDALHRLAKVVKDVVSNRQDK